MSDSPWSYYGDIRTSPLGFQEYMELKYPGFKMEDYTEVETQCAFCLHQLDEEGGNYAALQQCNKATHTQKIENLERNGTLEQLFEDKEERLLFKIHNSPLYWAKFELQIESLGWHQELLLDCTSKRRCAILGRRAGKTFTLCVLALWMAVNKIDDRRRDGRYAIIIAAPFEKVLGNVWGELNARIQTSRSLRSKIRQMKKSAPMTIEFKNGAEIKLMVAGESVRGQSANAIFVDEADYCDPSFIPAITPITLTSPETLLWFSSTPTGRRTNFYDYVNNKSLGYKTYAMPSFVSSNWNAKFDREYRATLSKAAYEHEVLAEFGDPEMGVYKKEDIRECFDRFQYSYADCSIDNPNENPRIMGVDWNEEKGVHILILEWDKNEEALKLVHKDVVESGDYKMTKGVQRVIKLMKAWAVDYCYVDRGAGKMAIEYMMIEGQKDRRLRMRQRLHPVDFSKKIEVRNPGTREFDKKHTKPFLVQLSVRFLETIKCGFPIEEAVEAAQAAAGDEDIMSTTLCRQMVDFVIDKYTANGVPVYKDENDHLIVAWWCAIFGFVQNFTNLLDYKATPKIKVDLTQLPSVRDVATAEFNDAMREKKEERVSIKDSISGKKRGDISIPPTIVISTPEGGSRKMNRPRNNISSGGRSIF